MYQIVFIHSSVDGHLGCFRVPAIVNSAAMNIGQHVSFFFFNLFLAALVLRCCVRVFSSCSERGLLFVTVRGLLIAVACLCCGARALGTQASVVVARGFSSCGLRAQAQ